MGNCLLGEHGLAAELGHVTIFPDGPFVVVVNVVIWKRFHLAPLSQNGPKSKLQQGQKSMLENTKTLSAKVIAEAAYEGDPLGIVGIRKGWKSFRHSDSKLSPYFQPNFDYIWGRCFQKL